MGMGNEKLGRRIVARLRRGVRDRPQDGPTDAHAVPNGGAWAVDNRPNTWQIRLVLMGNKEHVVMGTEDNIRQLHNRVKAALDQLGP